MKIDNKKTMERFLIIGGFIFLMYLCYWIYNIYKSGSPATILIQSVVLLILFSLIVFLWWLWKEAQY